MRVLVPTRGIQASRAFPNIQCTKRPYLPKPLDATRPNHSGHDCSHREAVVSGDRLSIHLERQQDVAAGVDSFIHRNRRPVARRQVAVKACTIPQRQRRRRWSRQRHVILPIQHTERPANQGASSAKRPANQRASGVKRSANKEASSVKRPANHADLSGVGVHRGTNTLLSLKTTEGK